VTVGINAVHARRGALRDELAQRRDCEPVRVGIEVRVGHEAVDADHDDAGRRRPATGSHHAAERRRMRNSDGQTGTRRFTPAS